MDADSEDGFSEMPTRPMRVKVLYTFDADSKVNCLARFSQTLQIPAVQIDDNSHVGVIALHKCLEAVIQASPELVNCSMSDFTIYAYDYSEHDIPLVGQGMLSAARTASMHHSVTAGPMITGRVCQNVPAIFSNGIKETLEVKLRFMPVHVVKVETKSMDIPRTSTPATSAGFDPNAWNASVQQTRPITNVSDLFNFDLESPIDDQVLMDDFLRLDRSGEQQESQHVGIARTPTDSVFGGHPAFAAHSHSAPGSRAGSPNFVSDYGPRNKQLRHQSFSVDNSYVPEQQRPGSRASVRSESHLGQHQTTPRLQNEQLSPSYEEFQDEDGQARKRAKITQTDWRGKSSFGGRSSDLRVTAATAASMQMYRPVPTRPSALGSNLEPPPRVPTPVPRAGAAPIIRGRPSVASKSLLRQGSTLTSEYVSDADQMSDAIASSPEDSPERSITAGATPLDIPSSPPVYPGLMPQYSHSPHQQTSADSGYMSERNQMLSESCSPEFSIEQPSQPFIKSELLADITPSYPFPMSDAVFDSDLPQMLPGEARADRLQGNQQRNSFTQPPYSQVSSRANSPLPSLAPAQSRGARLNNATRRGSLALPPIMPHDKPAQLQRSRSQYLDSEAGSPAPSEAGRPSGPRRSGSGAPRRKIIEERLHNAVAKGEMPQYCSHCGAIETPTWRRLYVKYCDGKPSPLDFVEGEGETIGIEDLEYNDDGEVSKFVIRKSMKKTKDFQPGKGFIDTQICNSCGLWFVKTRKMRPQDKWGRKSGRRKSRKGQAKAGEMTDGIEPPSEAFYTDALGPEDSYEDDIPDLEQVDSSTSRDNDAESRRPSAETQQRRFSGEPTWNQPRVGSALEHMTRPSPPGNDGTQESPIELDGKTPKPTRRLLFPSPRQEGVAKTLDNGELSFSATKTNSVKAVAVGQTNMTIFGAYNVEKENLPPCEDDALAALFDGSPSALFKTPMKTPLRRSPRTNKLYEQSTERSPSARKRKANVLSKPCNNKPHANDFMTSPASSRYFLRSTPTRLAVTPGRRSQNESRIGSSQEASPFSRQLAEMLTNDVPLDFGSPSADFAFSNLPAFTSPGGQLDWDAIDAMNSDFAELEGVLDHA